jgi:hypothetical protein
MGRELRKKEGGHDRSQKINFTTDARISSKRQRNEQQKTGIIIVLVNIIIPHGMADSH